MSAIAALKGYRTQFLYSLHFILSNLQSDQIFRLEGEEDLDVLASDYKLLYAIQLKNLSKTLTLSDILSNKKTSFIKRFIDNYNEAIPVLVSYGEISQELKSWMHNKDTLNKKEEKIIKKHKISVENWSLVKSKVQFTEINEEKIAEEIQKMLKMNFPMIDPVPTIGFLLNWLYVTAENQHTITTKDFLSKIEDFAIYLSERIAVHEQYGNILTPLHKISLDNTNHSHLEREFYNANSTKYEHILLGLEVNRDNFLEEIELKLKESNTVIIKGASGQGKTTLLYSYVNKYINDLFSFELNIQQNPLITQKSIQAIASMCKKLELPVVFIINVLPNNTEWLQIIKKSAHHNHIKFLVAVRNEDWYRATAMGIEFEHKEIDLVLSRDEAEIIYSRLNKIKKISHFTDFEEAWIQLGDNAPLLELIYSITHGDSLYNKLKQQVQQILEEGGITNNFQIEFLRIVSLADSFGAKIDVSKLNTDYQFIIEKLENEYLIKITTDRRFIEGLHTVRSQKLIEILFDEFACRKEDYSYKCIPLIAEEDLYLFLVHLFHLDILITDRFMEKLDNLLIKDWSEYASIIKSLLWVGVREYVEYNRITIDTVRKTIGDSWIIFIDFMFNSNFNRNEFLNQANLNSEMLDQLVQWNEEISPNTNVFNYCAKAINKLSLPQNTPDSEFEWRSYGEVLFWLKNIEHKREYGCTFSQAVFEKAFMALSSNNLSKLMLGMYSHSQDLNKIRQQYLTHFIDKLKNDFDLIHVEVGVDEISIHYIVDVLEYESVRQTNDFAVSVLNILRTAFPDRKKFTSQGHGHRLKNLSMDYDETHKSISIENLPLEEWTKINSCIIQLYEYNYRPKDWLEYCQELNIWEVEINEKITEFIKGFLELKRSKTYSPVVPIMQHIAYKNLEKIKEPKSITDSLGIYSSSSSLLGFEKEQKNIKLQSKHETFFKSFSNFNGSIENFISQSAHTLKSVIQLINDKNHIHNKETIRLSQINLYNAIENLKIFNATYNNTLGNIDSNHSSQISINTLLTVATIWKDFLSGSKKGEHSPTRILKLKSDFEKRIVNECKNISKNNPFSIRYVNDLKTLSKPTFIIDSKNPYWSFVGMTESYKIIQKVISNAEFTSLKFLMLQLWFQKTHFIQTVLNKPIRNQWSEIPLYKIKDVSLNDLAPVYLIPKPIDVEILQNLKLESWSQLYSEFQKINSVVESYSRISVMVSHFYDLKEVDEIRLNEPDKSKLSNYFNDISLKIQNDLQTVLNSLSEWLEIFPFNEEAYVESKEEQAYFEAIFEIKDNLFPQSKGVEENYQVELNMEIMEGWIERLEKCNQSWSIFILLLYGKYIDKYHK